MRIAQIAPPWLAVPPKGYGGIEWVIALLADGLAEAGHDVTLFATGDSTTKATLDVKYLEGDNLQGFAYRDAGLSSGTDTSGISIEYGRASSTNKNPRYAGQNPWDLSAGVVYKALQPAP